MTALDVKAFDFATKAKAGSAKVAGSFTIGDDKFDIRPVKDASLAYLVHRISGGEPDKVISAVLNFTERALTPESAKRFESVVLGDGSEDSGLELEQVVEVFEYILTVVSGDVSPTSPTASSTRRRTTGSASTAKPRARASTR